MKKYLFIAVVLVGLANIGYGQMKPPLTPSASNQQLNLDELHPVLNISNGVPKTNRPLFSQLKSSNTAYLQLTERNNSLSKLKIVRAKDEQLPIMIKGIIPLEKENNTPQDRSVQNYQYLETIKSLIQIERVREEFEIIKTRTDDLGQTHTKMKQMYRGLEVYGGEVVLHRKHDKIHLFNGRYFPTPQLENIDPTVTESDAIEVALEKVGTHSRIKNLNQKERKLIAGDPIESQLLIFHPNGKLDTERLTWKIDVIPNIISRWTYFIDAHTGEVLHSFNHVCQLAGGESCRHEHTSNAPKNKPSKLEAIEEKEAHFLPPPDGPATAQANDLFGNNLTINTYEKNNGFYLIDAIRNMHNETQSNFPNDPVGVIWTIDAFDTSPQNDNFSYDHVFSNNNTWNSSNAVSAHYNGGMAYEYFEDIFNRNSINGQGGNIISLINVAEENGEPMDNAFWNGAAMFYGSGNQAFFPLARGLDVAGHEMAHGVVQAEANLEYFGESGALNESFADVFGAMIDRNDWQIGEDVVRLSAFPSGALRDMSDPHNGGSGLSSPGWQPAHVNEQFTGSQDNGGVHINSGIPNKAFFLLASDIGKSKAEDIYYRALERYLVRSSQFIDMRLAAVEAADDLFGNTEVNAVRSAFDQVGIFNGQGSDTQVDIEENPGTEFILLTDGSQSALYLADPDGNLIQNPLQSTAIISKPSITDDGSFAIYIASDKTMRAYDFANDEEFVLQDQPIWRNVAISKDGNRMAALLDDIDNTVLVYDFVSENWGPTYELYNPTFAENVATGDALYADAMEWDYNGEFLMYDALNRIEGTTSTQDIDYWDIGFIRLWDNTANNFGDGFITKLFSGLPEDVSVGNPTFAKNSPYIIAFDYLDEFNGSFELRGANIETGDINTIFNNIRLSYPSFASDDKDIVFDAETQSGEAILAIRGLASDKISPSGDASGLITGGKWGLWFATGERILSSNEELIDDDAFFKTYPNPFEETIVLEWDLNLEATQIEIFDVLGQLVRTEKVALNTNQLRLNLEDLEKGSYYVHLISNTTRVSRKIVKF